MKKLLIILTLFGIVLNSYSQTVINLSPDSTLYDLHLLPPGAVTPVDTTIHYVKNGGNDLLDGWTDATAWATVDKVNSHTFYPGDSILFKSGDVWRETDTISSSGTSGNPIVYSSYGAGIKPKILGSEKATTWTSYQGDTIWQSADSLARPPVNTTIFFVKDGVTTLSDSVGAVARLTEEYLWMMKPGGDSTILIYAATDPDVRYDSVEVPQRLYCFHTTDESYIVIDGVDMHYSTEAVTQNSPTPDVDSLVVKNSHLAYHGNREINAVGSAISALSNDILILNNTIHDAGRRGFDGNNYSDLNFSNVRVIDNVFYNGYHTTGPDIATGAGGNDGNIDSIIISGNTIYEGVDKPDGDVATNLIWLQGPHGGLGTVSNVYVYNNVFKHNYTWGIALEDVDTFFFHNNTFYEHNKNNTAGNQYYVYLSQSHDEGEVKNNIFYTTRDTDVGVAGISVRKLAGETTELDYNLYWRTADDIRIAIIDGVNYYRTTASFDALKVAGYETNSQYPADPLVFSNDYLIRTGGPPIDSGVVVAFTSPDFYGTARIGDWWQGAVQSSRDGDTSQVFTVSGTAVTGKKDTVLVNATIFSKQPDSLRLVIDQGNDSIGEGGGTLLYAGTDTTAVQNDEFRYKVSTDTIVRVELHHKYDGVWSLYGNIDTTNVDSTGLVLVSQYVTVRAAMANPPGISTDTTAAQNEMVRRIVDTSAWDTLMLFYVMAVNNEPDAYLNWIDPTGDDNLENISSTLFTKYEGFTGDGSADRLETNFTPSTEGGKFTQNRASVGVYTRLDRNASEAAVGAYDGSNQLTLYPRNSGNLSIRINSSNSHSVAVANSQGLFVGTRISSSTVEAYKGGVSLGTSSEASTGLPSVEIQILARTGQVESANQVSVMFLGGYLSDEQVAEVNAAIEEYMDFIGKGVQ